MTPKEKAEELFDKYFNEMRMPSDCDGCMQCVDRCESMVVVAKRYALIAVDEILYALSVPPIQNKGRLLYDSQIDYWQQVKQELEKL